MAPTGSTYQEYQENQSWTWFHGIRLGRGTYKTQYILEARCSISLFLQSVFIVSVPSELKLEDTPQLLFVLAEPLGS
jgi:hypothetical protein